MKRTIAILLMAVLLCLPFSAYADFEPVPDTPYGIPLYDSPEEVDLSVVLEGNGKLRLLDQLGAFKATEDLKQTGDYEYSSYDDIFYIKETTHSEYMGQYFRYTLPVGSDGLKMSSLRSYDESNPIFHALSSDGNRRDSTINPGERNTVFLKRPAAFEITPEEYDFEITNSEVTGGMYYVEFNMTPKSGDDSYTYSNCSVLIDPETSLIYEYTYSYYSAKSGNTQEISGELDYNVSVDEIPDYSVLF